METRDEFSKQYQNLLDGTYDCIDRIVVNAYFPLLHSPGGLRTWWRGLMGDDTTLDNAHLMRLAGRFSRRVRAYARQNQIPIRDCRREDDERKHQIAHSYIPKSPDFRGVFCILVGRAPAPVYEVRRYSSGALDIRKKAPLRYVNHYSFHIMDPLWGHMTIKLCPHPPFNAQIIFNGHEYAAIQAKKAGIGFTKEDNCFTDASDAEGLTKIADTMRAPGFEGRLLQACERWIYSTCLCFALDTTEQQRTGFRYCYSVYQTEYSRNLLFSSGAIMDQIFQAAIDRTRAPLDIKTVKTIFGYKSRPYRRNRRGKQPRFEVVVERPTYNLTIFKVHFGKLTLKIYSKGERVLRIEAIAHNARDLSCGRTIDKFPSILEQLKAILDRFLAVLRSVDASFIDLGTMESWPLPSQVGASRVGGIDVNRPRIRAVMEAVISLSPNPHGFTVSDVAQKVREITADKDMLYQPRHASYDLKKLRAKQLVDRIGNSRRYQASCDGLRTMTAFIIIREKVLRPLLASAGKPTITSTAPHRSQIDICRERIQIEMQNIFQCLNIAVPA